MSEFLAEAKVLIRPDIKGFEVSLKKQLAAVARRSAITVPVAAGTVAGSSAAGLAGATAGLVSSQEKTRRSAAQTAGALNAVNKSTKATTASMLGAASASAKLDAALLGVRTAAGSSAVIGLGALALSAIVVGKALRSVIGLTVDFETQLNTFQAVSSRPRLVQPPGR